jgi:integrase/recombinase XerD
MTIVPHPRFRPDDLPRHVADFLADLEQADRSPHTLRAYAADLRHFAAHHRGALADVDAACLRAYFATLAGLAPATRARKQAALASFLGWAYRHDLIAADPMGKVARVEAILKAIPRVQRRDRLLFRLLYATGLRIGEALGVHAEDLDLTADDERLTVTGKGGRRRTILLDDPALVRELRAHLGAGGRDPARARGPLFRALKGGRGGPLRYQSIHERWARYCAAVGVACTLHQLRHSHATELVNGGVGLETIRRRLGHKHIQTTLRYAEQRDGVGDAEVRAWRRRGAGR